MATRVKQFMERLRMVIPDLPVKARKVIEERAMSLHRLYEKVWVALDYDEWLVDLLVDGDTFNVIVGRDANLYLRTLTFDGDDISLGAPVRIVESYEVIPENRTKEDSIERLRGTVQVHRQADGKHRWVMRACTSVLNRVGQIDSDEMFDEFVTRFYSGEYETPYMTVRHMEKAMYLGDMDWVARDGHILCTSGTFDTDPDNVLAQAAIVSLERDADYWGVSIGFQLEADDPSPDVITHKVRAGDKEIEIPIPVYRKGTLIEQSILDETECAAFFTDVVRMEVLREMPTKRKQRNLDADLLTLFEGDQEALDAYKAGNDATNRAITDNGLITRNSDSDSDSDDDNSDVDTPESDEDTDIEIDDELLAQLMGNEAFVDAVAARIQEGNADENIRTMLARALGDIEELQSQVEELTETNAELLGLGDDKPRRTKNKVRFTSGKSKRPRDQKRAAQKATDEDDEGYDDPNELLDDVLETIPVGR